MSLAGLDWALCRTFLAILREGSLSGAARALGVAHPTVCRHLGQLEASLGSTLFLRSPSGLIPTELAVELRAPAEAMEAAAEQLVRTASAEAGVIAGTVRVTASEVMGAEVLPPILASLKLLHPRLTFELALTNSVEDLLRRDADVAVRMTRPAQGDLIARRVGLVPLGLFAHERWLAAHGEPTDLDGIVAAGGLIGYDRDPALLSALAAQGATATRADFGFRSDSDLAQLAALRSGLGVAVCQMPLAARGSELRRVLPGFHLGLDIWLVTHPDLRGVARVRTTLDALAVGLTDYLRAGGPTDAATDRSPSRSPGASGNRNG